MPFTQAELGQLRADEEALLPDTCTVTRKGAGEPVFNESTGQYENPDPDTIYTGACRIAPLAAQARAVVFGERAVDLIAYQASFPYDAPAFEKDDQVGVTASADAQLVGRVLEVHSFAIKSLQTKRRVILQEVR